MKFIQCSINHLKNGFIKAMEKRRTSLDEVTKLNNAYQELSAKFNREIDYVERSTSQKFQQQLNQLKKNFKT